MNIMRISAKRKLEVESELKNKITIIKIHSKEFIIDQITQRNKSAMQKTRVFESTQAEQKKKKIVVLKSKNNLRFIWEINGTKIHIIGVPQGKKREKVTAKLFE